MTDKPPKPSTSLGFLELIAQSQFAPVGTPIILGVEFNIADARKIKGPNIQVLRDKKLQSPNISFGFFHQFLATPTFYLYCLCLSLSKKVFNQLAHFYSYFDHIKSKR